MRCLGSRNANPSTLGARTHECINPLWRTAACCAWSQLSVFRKRHIKSFATSRLRSRRFACAVPRIAQRKSINIRSAHSRVHKSYLAHRCVLRVVSAFGSQKKAYQSFATSRLQSRRFACAVPRIAQRKSINIRSAHSRVHKSYLAHRCVLRVVSAFGFRKRHIKVLRLHDFNRGDSRVRCLGSRNANPSTLGAHTHECINPLWRTAACCAWSQLSVFRKRHIKVLRLHDFDRGDLRVRCLGSRNANPSTFGARNHECINLIWRTATCFAWSQLSVFRKRHIKVL